MIAAAKPQAFPVRDIAELDKLARALPQNMEIDDWIDRMRQSAFSQVIKSEVTGTRDPSEDNCCRQQQQTECFRRKPVD